MPSPLGESGADQNSYTLRVSVDSYDPSAR
jgi:hypothetical protein